MDNFSAFVMGEANRGKEEMVFDWDKAARIIKELGAEDASAGLRNDWDWTGGYIFRGGKPCYSEFMYLASTWAVPELEIDGEVIPCYRMKSETGGWNSHTKWPESSLSIIEGHKIRPFFFRFFKKLFSRFGVENNND